MKEPCPRAVRVFDPSLPSLPSCSSLQLSSQKYEEGERALREACKIDSEHQTRLQVMQQHLEQLKQQEQCLHQANTPSPSLPGLGLLCQGPEPLPTASLSLSPGDGAGAAEHGSPEETARTAS